VHIQVMGSYEDHRPQDRCRECARRGIPYLTPAAVSPPARRGERPYDHCHPTPYGYSVGPRILAGLDCEKLIPN
jgi:hypothetical protein